MMNTAPDATNTRMFSSLTRRSQAHSVPCIDRSEAPPCQGVAFLHTKPADLPRLSTMRNSGAFFIAPVSLQILPTHAQQHPLQVVITVCCEGFRHPDKHPGLDHRVHAFVEG